MKIKGETKVIQERSLGSRHPPETAKVRQWILYSLPLPPASIRNTILPTLSFFQLNPF